WQRRTQSRRDGSHKEKPPGTGGGPGAALTGGGWQGLGPLCLGVGVWVLTAPPPRVGAGRFWGIPAVSVALCVGACLTNLPRRWFNLLVAGMVAFALAPTAGWVVLASMGKAQPVSLWTKPGSVVGKDRGITKGFGDVNTVEMLKFRT